MGFFSNLLNLFSKKKISETMTHAQSISGGLPIYTTYGREVYTSDAVQTAIYCIVREMKKLAPQHVRKRADGKDTQDVYGNIQRVLEDPNPLMTTSEFIEKVVWELFQRFNAFIVPTYVEIENKDGSMQRRYTALYPIAPLQTDFEENSQGELYVKFRFANNYEISMPYSDVIHLRYRFNLNDYMGGDKNGDPDNDTLADTVSLNKQILDGLATMMQSGSNVNGVVKYNSLLDDGKMENAIKEFNELLRKNTSGFLPIDLKAEYIPIKRDVKYIDPETVKFIDEKILRYFGVSLAILKGDYTAAQFEAFYSTTLEPLVIDFSQAFTKRLFTPTERGRGHGNKIVFQPGEMVFMTTTEKLEMVRLLGDCGSLYENEKRRAFGLRAIPELEGKRMMSLNYVDSGIAQQVQTQGNGGNASNGDGD